MAELQMPPAPGVIAPKLRSHHAEGDKQTPILRLIAAFKLAKGTLLLLLALAALRLMHRDVAEIVRKILLHVRADPESKHFHNLLGKLANVHPRTLAEFGVGAFIYSSLYFIEGIGLLLTRRWAEWMAVITTGGFIPLEVYEVVRDVHVIRIGVLCVNIAIVIYLIWELRRKNAKLIPPQPMFHHHAAETPPA